MYISMRTYVSRNTTADIEHEFNRNPKPSNTFSHLHLKLTFYGIRRRVFWLFNVTLRKKKEMECMKKQSLCTAKRCCWHSLRHIYARTWTLQLEKNDPKTNYEVTNCPMDTVLLSIVSCMTPTLQLFLQYSLMTTQEDIIYTDSVSNPNAKQAVHKFGDNVQIVTNGQSRLPRLFFPQLKANTKGADGLLHSF